MPDPIFAHPRLAVVYDAFDGERDDLPAYRDIAAGLAAGRVLDVGCGTGNLALLLAGAGHEVIGADPAEASLAVARAKDTAGRVTWIHGGPTALPALAADLAVMTGNVAQVFLTDDGWAETLRGVRAALRTHGHLVFETRRPQRRAWEEPSPRDSTSRRTTPHTAPMARTRTIGTAPVFRCQEIRTRRPSRAGSTVIGRGETRRTGRIDGPIRPP